MMGHAPNRFDISTTYKEELSDAVLDLVCGHIRSWLFGPDYTAESENNWLMDAGVLASAAV
jgi:hypothetical protein